jgi:hypothetical protein
VGSATPQRSKPLVTTPGDEASAVERMEADVVYVRSGDQEVAVVPRQQPCDGSCPIDDALNVTPTTSERPYELLGLGLSPLVDGQTPNYDTGDAAALVRTFSIGSRKR